MIIGETRPWNEQTVKQSNGAVMSHLNLIEWDIADFIKQTRMQ